MLCGCHRAHLLLREPAVQIKTAAINVTMRARRHNAIRMEPVKGYVLNRKLHAALLVLERYYNCDIIEAMRHPNKSKKDPVTEWAVGQPLVMQTEQETTRKTKLGSPPTVSRVKKTLPAKQRTGMRKKPAVSKHQPKNKRNSP